MFAAAVFAAAPEKANLFPDPQWERGFNICNGPAKQGELHFDADGEEPVWILAEHNSRFNLAETAPHSVKEGMQAETPGNLVSMTKNEKGERVLTLGVFAENEYDAPRGSDRGWPHLLICMNFAGENVVPFRRERSVHFSADLRVPESVSKMKEDEYDPGLHCGQVSAYFIVRPADPDSPDRNDYVWLGIAVFDSRYEFPVSYVGIDQNPDGNGTGKLIWLAGGTETLEKAYRGKNPRSGQWTHLEVTLDDYKEAALKKAQEAGFLTHTKPEDLEIDHFNLGWESPGTFHSVLQIKNLRLWAE